MQTVVIVLHLLIVLAMIGLVLLQRSEGGALGIGGGGGGGGGGFLSSRGTSNVLTKATAGLAAAFFTTSLVLSILAGWGQTERSIIGTPAAPTAPGAPPAGDTILDQLRPPEPSGPQVPQSQ